MCWTSLIKFYSVQRLHQERALCQLLLEPEGRELEWPPCHGGLCPADHLRGPHRVSTSTICISSKVIVDQAGSGGVAFLDTWVSFPNTLHTYENVQGALELLLGGC